MIHWLYKFINPHCPDCLAKELANKVCESCDSLRSENAFLRQQVMEYQSYVLHPPVHIEKEIDTSELKPIQSNIRKPFHIIRQELETKDRELAKQLDKQILEKNEIKTDINVTQEISDIENELKEMGIKENAS